MSFCLFWKKYILYETLKDKVNSRMQSRSEVGSMSTRDSQRKYIFWEVYGNFKINYYFSHSYFNYYQTISTTVSFSFSHTLRFYSRLDRYVDVIILHIWTSDKFIGILYKLARNFSQRQIRLNCFCKS